MTGDQFPEKLEKIASLVDPSKRDKKGDSYNFEDLVRDVLVALGVGSAGSTAPGVDVADVARAVLNVWNKAMSENEIKNLADVVNKEVLQNICKCDSDVKVSFSEDPVKDVDNGSAFVRGIVRLKKISEEIKNKTKNKKCKEINKCKKILFMFDTCYNGSKAAKLEKALERLRWIEEPAEKEKSKGQIKEGIDEEQGKENKGKERLRDDEFKAFLALLAAVYTKMIKNADYVLRAEWFPLLARTAAGATGSGNRNSYLPVCPSKGDVAAILYYLYGKIGKNESITINEDIVRDIVVKLAGLSSCPKDSAGKGCGQ